MSIRKTNGLLIKNALESPYWEQQKMQKPKNKNYLTQLVEEESF